MAKKKLNEMTETYRVLGPVRHDGDNYVAGDDIDLTHEQALMLKAVGAVENEAPVADESSESSETPPAGGREKEPE